MFTLPIYNTEGKEIETLKLNPGVFDGNVNKEAVYQAIVAYRANQRKGLASTKTRGEVSGGGKKPWRQKGTGRARVGSTRSPLWKHGGVVFGPHPRDFSYELPKKIRLAALKSVLNEKIKENNLLILDDMKLASSKTKEAYKIFGNLKLAGKKKTESVLFLLHKIDNNTRLALRNISFLSLGLASDTHAYEVVTHKKIILTKDGVSDIVKRFK
jgi:large subunit ribosomal protein L4